MPIKTRLERLTKAAATLPSQDAGPEVDEVIVHDADGTHVYSSEAEALLHHPWIDDPEQGITVIVPEKPAKSGK